MNFIQPGTVADETPQDMTVGIFESLNITSSEAYDIEAIFQRLSLRLDQLEKQENGTQEEIDRFTEEANRLPRFSEERLECDIRMKALKKKWGLNKKKAAKPEPESISFPIELDQADEILIQKMNADYIDSGKEGRLWIQSWIKKQGVVTIESEDKLNQLVKDAVAELKKLIQTAESTSLKEELEYALRGLEIRVDKRYVSRLFENWQQAERAKLTTVGQIKKWVDEQETGAIMDQKSVDVLDSRLLDRVIDDKE